MKKIFLYLIAVFPLTAFAQEPQSFEIKSKIGDLNAPSRAYLLYQLGANKVVDSAIIAKGSFDFKGQILTPTNALLVIDHKGVGLEKLDSTADVLSFYIDKGEFSINSADSASKAQITGSKINDDNKKLMAQLKPLIERAKKLKALENAAAPIPLPCIPNGSRPRSLPEGPSRSNRPPGKVRAMPFAPVRVLPPDQGSRET